MGQGVPVLVKFTRSALSFTTESDTHIYIAVDSTGPNCLETADRFSTCLAGPAELI